MPETPDAHKELGDYIAKSGDYSVCFVGRFGKYIEKSSLKNLNLIPTISEIKTEHFEKAKFIFVKGSRSLQLESIVDILKGL